MSKVVIIDYQLGNLFSVRQALHNIGLEVIVSQKAEDIEKADALVLPGVGAFGDAMKSLHKQDLVIPTLDAVAAGKPFLGICLGLQLLFSESEEFGANKGLNLVPGVVKRFNNFNSTGEVVKVPQIAWNEIYPYKLEWSGTPLDKIKKNEHMYFVHSFYVEPENKDHSLTLTNYSGTEYTSSVFRDNIFACQFHPEKSAENGLEIYRSWALQNNLIK